MSFVLTMLFLSIVGISLLYGKENGRANLGRRACVLTRKEHLPPGVTVDAALGYLRYLASVAHLQDVHFLWRPFLRDPDDDMVLECAAASACQFIVTHNVNDFRRTLELKVEAIKPDDFLKLLRNRS